MSGISVYFLKKVLRSLSKKSLEFSGILSKLFNLRYYDPFEKNHWNILDIIHRLSTGMWVYSA